MISFWRIFWLETVALWRGGTAALLLAASVGWIVLLPHVLIGDGTSEGARQMSVRYGLGGVFALLVVSLLAAATGAIAAEREAKRLQLTQVRPVPFVLIAWGKFLAMTALGALVLAVAAWMTVDRESSVRSCNHVYRPVLESPREEAEKMYDVYMADPDTPPEARKASRGAIVRMLAQRARDRYVAVRTNAVESWTFAGFPVTGQLSARFKFTNTFDMRADVCGRVSFGGASGSFSNITRTAAIVRLEGNPAGDGVLSFENQGTGAVMLRPRQDVELLVPADGFTANLIRATLEMIAVLALVIAFGVFLGAGLSRPVALFVALVLLTVSEMSPSVIDQYPDGMESDRIDRIGLFLTRGVERITHPVSALSPLGRLADDDCVEWPEVARAAVVNILVLPFFLSLAAGLLLTRKTE